MDLPPEGRRHRRPAWLAGGKWTVLGILIVCCVSASVVFGLGARELRRNSVDIGATAFVLDDGRLDQAEIDWLTPLKTSGSAVPTADLPCQRHLANFGRLHDWILGQKTPSSVEVILKEANGSASKCSIWVPERSAPAGMSVLVATVLAGVLPLVGIASGVILTGLRIPRRRMRAQIAESAAVACLVASLALLVAGAYRFESQNLVLFLLVAVCTFWPVLNLRVAATMPASILLGGDTFETNLERSRLIDDNSRVVVVMLAGAFSLAVAFVAALNGRYMAQNARLTLKVGQATFGGFRSADLPLVNAIESILFAVVLIVVAVPTILASRSRGEALLYQLRADSPATASNEIKRVLNIEEQAKSLGLVWRTAQTLEAGLAMLAPILTGAASQFLGFGR